MKISLILPALNEEEALPAVLAGLKSIDIDEIIVVDNGSTDDTSAVARRAGARVVQEPRRGYGAACLAGALASADGGILVFMDSDGSFDPAEVRKLAQPIERGEADLVLGARLSGAAGKAAQPLHSRAGNILMAWLTRKKYGLLLMDISPFRAIKKADLLSLEMKEMTYGWPIEMILKAARGGLRIIEVPVVYNNRVAGKSKVSGNIKGSIKASLAILKALLFYF